MKPYYDHGWGRYSTGESYDVFYKYEDHTLIHTSQDEVWTYAFVEDGIELLRYNDSQTDITIPSVVDGQKVVSMDSTFDGFFALKRVVVPEGVKSVTGAFYGCEGLEQVTLPSSITDLHYAFNCCYSLKNLTLPQSVENFSFCFEGTGLTEIIFPPSTKNISQSFMASNHVKSVFIPKSVVHSAEAFSDCEVLEKVELENGLEGLDKWAIFNCLSLKEVTIPPSVTNFGKMAVGFMEIREYTSPEKTGFRIKGHQIVPGFQIKGIAGSAAEAYAKKHKIPFISLL